VQRCTSYYSYSTKTVQPFDKVLEAEYEVTDCCLSSHSYYCLLLVFVGSTQLASVALMLREHLMRACAAPPAAAVTHRKRYASITQSYTFGVYWWLLY
jgi:hypothetical protein